MHGEEPLFSQRGRKLLCFRLDQCGRAAGRVRPTCRVCTPGQPHRASSPSAAHHGHPPHGASEQTDALPLLPSRSADGRRSRQASVSPAPRSRASLGSTQPRRETARGQTQLVSCEVQQVGLCGQTRCRQHRLNCLYTGRSPCVPDSRPWKESEQRILRRGRSASLGWRVDPSSSRAFSRRSRTSPRQSSTSPASS